MYNFLCAVHLLNSRTHFVCQIVMKRRKTEEEEEKKYTTRREIEKEKHVNGQKMYECMALKCVVEEDTSRM